MVKLSRDMMSRWTGLVSALLLGAFVPNLHAQSYDKLMDDGYQLLKQGEHERLLGELDRTASKHQEALVHYSAALSLDKRALASFRAAEHENRKSPHPIFFQGVALNEAGQAAVDYKASSVAPKLGAPTDFCAAGHELRRAISMGLTPNDNPDLFFQLGWALTGCNDLAQGVAELDKFLASRPIDPDLKARAEQLRTSAIEKLKKAMLPTVSPMCGQPIFPKGADPDGKDKPVNVQNTSQFLISLTTGIGDDGNVAKLGRTLPLPPTLDGKSALFSETTLSLENDWFLYHKQDTNVLIDKVALSYAAIADYYDSHSASDTFGQTALATYCHALNPNWCVGFQTGDTWLRDDSTNLSNTLAFGPNISYAASPTLVAQLSYTVGWSVYFAPTTSLADPDGFTQRVSLQEVWTAIQRPTETFFSTLTLTAQYGQEWTATEGVVSDRERSNPLGKVELTMFKALDYCSFVRSVVLSSSYEFRHDQYQNPAIPSPGAVNAYKRVDDTHLVDIALSIKMLYDEDTKNRLEALFEYKYATDNSNVPGKAYDDPRFLASLKVTF